MDPRSLSRVALVALVGCVDASRPVSRAAAGAVTRERARDLASDRLRRAALLPIPHVQRERPRPVLTEGGVTHTLAGPLRVDVRGDDATPAADFTDAPMVAAAKGERGWVFITASAVYASETFTGRLRLLRSFACEPGAEPTRVEDRPVVELHTSAGRVAFTVLEHGTFWSDGASMEALDVPGAVASAWRDASRGAVIVEHRALKVTSDGGRTWRDVDTRGEVVVMVEGSAGALVVRTERGRWRVDEEALTLVAAPTAAAEDPPCPPDRRVEAIASLYERRYEQASAAPPTETCERQRARRRNGWTAPAFDVSLPGSTLRATVDTYSAPTWRVARSVAAPFGPPWARAFVDSVLAPAVVRVTARSGERGYRGGLLWRGRDAAGPFRGAAQVQTPSEAPVESRWALVAATRLGALVQLDALPPGRRFSPEGTGDDLVGPALFWVTPTGLRRVALDPAWSLAVRGAIPDDRGGVVVLGADTVARPEPCVATTNVWTKPLLRAIHLGPDGAVLGARAVVDEPAVRAVVGVGRRGDRWGIVVAERSAPGALRLLSFEGEATDFGAWGLGATPRVCGAAVGDVTRLHLLYVPEQDGRAAVTFGADAADNGEPFAHPRSVTLERAGEGACVRAVRGVHRSEEVENSPENFHAAFAALNLDANGERLVGTYDDGRRIAALTGTLGPTAP